MDLKTNLIRTYYPSIPSRINTETNFGSLDLSNKTLEAAIDEYLTLPLPSNGTTSYTSTLMQKDLEHLNRKLSAVRKTITAWDTYKITEVVVEKELLAGKIQGLPLNSSLVVNTSESVYLNGKTYQLGDIVFKDINGNLHQIKSAPSGFFYPSYIGLLTDGNGEKTNTMQIDYSFFAGSQPPTEEQTILEETLTQPSHTIIAQLELQEDNNFYNDTGELAPHGESNDSHSLNKIGNTLPKVFAYLSDNGTALEEIYIDNLVAIGDTIIINNPTTLTIKYIMR